MTTPEDEKSLGEGKTKQLARRRQAWKQKGRRGGGDRRRPRRSKR